MTFASKLAAKRVANVKSAPLGIATSAAKMSSGRMPVPLNLGSLLDLACTELTRRPRAKRATRLIVHPSVYRCVAEAHRHQTDRRLPLMLLGLELQQSDLRPPDGFRIAD